MSTYLDGNLLRTQQGMLQSHKCQLTTIFVTEVGLKLLQRSLLCDVSAVFTCAIVRTFYLHHMVTLLHLRPGWLQNRNNGWRLIITRCSLMDSRASLKNELSISFSLNHSSHPGFFSFFVWLHTVIPGHRRQVQNTDIPIQQHQPFWQAHMHLRGVQLRPARVTLFI